MRKKFSLFVSIIWSPAITFAPTICYMGNSNQVNYKKPGKSWGKKLNAWLHLWLGLVSGVIVLIVSITGCLFVFQKEINEWVHHDIMYVTPTGKPALPFSELEKKAQAAIGKEMPIRGTITYRQPDRAWEFMTYAEGDENALTIFGAHAYYKIAFVNPYTGAVTQVRDMRKDFFVIVKYIHWSLLLNDKYGQPIVGWATFIFVVLLITGLILWWPKKWTKKTREQSFKIKWSGNFKRLNYDLHNVLGFYALVISLVLALTGIVWSFKWFEATVYVIASRSVTPPKHKEVKSDTLALARAGVVPVDIAYAEAVKQFPEARRIGVWATPPTNTATLRMSVYWGKETFYDRDDLQFDKNTGKLLLRETAKDRNAGEKLIGMNYDIHVGAIAGLPGKILAFFASLICASLPVTGFLVWWHRGKKEKKTSKQHHKRVRRAQAGHLQAASANSGLTTGHSPASPN